MKVKTAKFGPFYGLNNTSDSMTLGTQWAVVADNGNFTDAGAWETREGYSKIIPGSFSSGITTKDYLNFFAVNGLTIVRVNDDLTTRVLCDLTSPNPVRFLEINKEVYFTNGVDSGLIKQDSKVYDWNWAMPEMPDVITLPGGVMDEGTYQVIVTHILMDGRETGASQSFVGFSSVGDSMVISGLSMVGPNVKEVLVYIKPPKSVVFQMLGYAEGDQMLWDGNVNSLGEEILDEFNSPLPGSFIDIVLWRGRVAWMQYNEQYDTTYIWFSEPLIYHQFRNEDFLAIKGKGALLCPHADGLVIGMEDEILSYDGEKIEKLAAFGTIPGYGVVADSDGTMLMWTKRGWCSVFPFVKLMEGVVSPAPGSYVGAAMIEKNGAKRVVAVLQSSGTPFNGIN